MGIINGTSASDILIGSIKSDTINGFAGNDTLRGLGGYDQLNGGDGEDLLDGGLGADTMNGGFGNDRYIVDDDGDVVVDLNLSYGEIFLSGGTDTFVSSISYILSETLENLELSGGKSNDINGTGNARDNVITGNGDNNMLTGLDGEDTLNGGPGDDLLDGGDGFDTVSYHTATAGVIIDLHSYGWSEQHTVGERGKRHLGEH